MKKKYFYLFIALKFVMLSQTNKNYILYHQSCRYAEKLFIDSNYTKCFITYDSIFNAYDILFPRDCFIASQLAFKTGKDSIAIEFLKKAVPFGLNAELIFKMDTSLYISKIRNSKYWENYMKHFPKLRQKYINSVDWTLKKQLYNIVQIDQQWRVKNNKWFNRTFRKSLEKKFNQINKKHISFLDSVFVIRGYPGIWLTGVGDSSDISFNNNNNLSEIFFVILYHHDSTYIKYGEFLKNEIINGHIHPRTYAMIRDFQDRFSVKQKKDQKMFYNIWWEAINFSSSEFERHCYEIGCPTKEHLRKLYKAGGENVDVFWWPYR